MDGNASVTPVPKRPRVEPEAEPDESQTARQESAGSASTNEMSTNTGNEAGDAVTSTSNNNQATADTQNNYDADADDEGDDVD